MIFPSRAELPCELWYKIFAQLEFYDLLAVKSTCYLWDSMIRNDTEIRSAMFELPIFADDKKENAVEFHPFFERMSYRMGDGLETLAIQTKGNDKLLLKDRAILQAQATRPATKYITLEIGNISKIYHKNLSVVVRREEGVRISDVLGAIIQETNIRCDLVALASGGASYQRGIGGLLNWRKVDMLGRERFVTLGER